MLDGSDQYQSFQKRLQESRVKTPGPQLSKLLSSDDYLTLLEFVETIPHVDKLKAGRFFHFNKEAYHLPRTLSLIRDYFGEFKLFVETKSKISTGEKQKLPVIEGAHKKGKPAWRIDGDELEYMNLVAFEDRYETESEIVGKIMQEVKIQNEYAAPYISLLDLGPSYFTGNKYKVSMYSPMALGTLETIVKNKDALLTKQVNDQFVHQMLNAVNGLHKMGIIHQDLKAENILVYQEQEDMYCLKITDFGLSLHKKYKYSSQLAGSPLFFSPEIMLANQLSKTMLWNHIRNVKGEGALAFELVEAKGFPLNKKIDTIPHKANDMWVVGINLYFLLHGDFPTLANWDIIQRCPLLKGLLSFSREERLTSEQALKVHYLIQNKQSLLTEHSIELYMETYSYLYTFLPHLHDTYIDSLSAKETSALLFLMKQRIDSGALTELDHKKLKRERDYNEKFNVDTNKRVPLLPMYNLHQEQLGSFQNPNASDYGMLSDSEDSISEDSFDEKHLCFLF